MKRILAGLMALAALAGCGPAQEKAPDGAPRTEIAFSILSTENSQNLEALWRPFLADMEKETGLKVTPFFASNYTGLIEAMRFNKVQVGWFSNASGLEAVRRADAEVFLRSSDPSGVDGYNSIIIVPAASPLKTADDLLTCDGTLDFGIGDAKSTSGTLAPMTFLFAPRKIDPSTCFKTVRSANHEGNLMGVANGLLDAATNNTTNLKRLARNQPEILTQVRTIWTSPKIPEDPILWRKDLDPATKEKVRTFFITYGRRGSPEQQARERKILADLDFGIFQPADDSHLLPVREMEATEKLLQAQGAGDAAAVKTAEADLAAIRAEAAKVAGEAPRP
jgi:phosphonate transport system substrate-binding protein